MAPPATQRAAFEKDGRPNSGPIVDRVTANIEDQCVQGGKEIKWSGGQVVGWSGGQVMLLLTADCRSHVNLQQKRPRPQRVYILRRKKCGSIMV